MTGQLSLGRDDVRKMSKGEGYDDYDDMVRKKESLTSSPVLLVLLSPTPLSALWDFYGVIFMRVHDKTL